MSKGISLHLGLNQIDPIHYAGTSGFLQGPKYDMQAMQEIAKFHDFKILFPSLSPQSVVRSLIINSFKESAKQLNDGDFFFFSFSGHGGLLPNLNINSQDLEQYDQTFCLYDGQIVDDELRRLLTYFVPGVRVLIISDSCYSGSIVKLNLENNLSKIKFLGNDMLENTYLNNKQFYDSILKASYVSTSEIRADVIMISSCKDDQVSLDGPYNSIFTKKLIEVWNKGEFMGNYVDFVEAIKKRSPATQTPQISCFGPTVNNFYNTKPFQI